MDINPKTGKIDRKYTDGGLVGAKVRKSLCEYVVSKGKIFVANTHAAVEETQALPVFRFMEAGWASKRASWKKGDAPPLLAGLCKGHFDSPIGLGVRADQISQAERGRHAEIIMKSIIVFLRHGLLYYYYSGATAGGYADGTFLTDLIPETGPGSGEYGPINHMFPMTPVELHKGWILGKERIVTAVSLNTLWKKKGKPVVLIFDIRGRETDPAGRYQIKRENGHWRVILDLNDWSEIGVVE